MNFKEDKIILKPDDIDLSYSPIQKITGEDTYVLGAFNPGFERLPNGNCIMMVRVAEALKQMTDNKFFKVIRWSQEKKYVIDRYPIEDLDSNDPRKYKLRHHQHAKVYGLTSFSWILPVELSTDGLKIEKIHYDKIIEPTETYQEYGIEDARITKIENKYWMTTCSVSSERHSTTLYSSDNGLDYKLEGIILDHQNKDMVLFPEKIIGKYFAFTRPLGDLYFTTPIDSIYSPGPSVNLAQSPDLLHWKPFDKSFIRAIKGSQMSMKLGSGTPPIRTENGWLALFHGVEKKGEVGIYRTFKVYLESDKPWNIKSIDYDHPVMEANPELTVDMEDKIYVRDVVFTTGIINDKNNFIIASGELDICCRITHIPKCAL
ncbi:MAG: glycosidase [Candidatus Marinimicrobia bacterium]|nr:glycosidase [Candidatus Neomarinimicrobiota bacterium]